MKYIVEISYEKSIFDAFGNELKKGIEEMGIYSVKKVNVADLYAFDGNIKIKEIKEIAENILLDRVSQKYSINKKTIKGKNLYLVEVWYKKGVTDMVSETTKKAISDYGLKKNINISTGKKYYIYCNLKQFEIKKICERLLVNPLIHDYKIERGK